MFVNKGAALLGLEQYEESLELLNKSIELNLFYSGKNKLKFKFSTLNWTLMLLRSMLKQEKC